MFDQSTLSSLEDIASSSSTPESEIKKVLRSLFSESINLPSSSVKPLIQKLSSRLDQEGANSVFGAANSFNARGDANATGETEAEAMKRVWEISVRTYGEEDVGVLVSCCLMNLLRMRKGEGAWILGKEPCRPLFRQVAIPFASRSNKLTLHRLCIADDLHAYVEGDIIECMA